MRLSKPIKIIIGLLTAWVMIYPFFFIGIWFYSIFSMSTMDYQYLPDFSTFSTTFLPIFFVVMCSSFLQLGLQAFYIVHIIINKTGGDVLRAVLGVGMFLLAILAMPVYYFIFILPDNPPQWALASSIGQGISPNPSGSNPNQPND